MISTQSFGSELADAVFQRQTCHGREQGMSGGELGGGGFCVERCSRTAERDDSFGFCRSERQCFVFGGPGIRSIWKDSSRKVKPSARRAEPSPT